MIPHAWVFKQLGVRVRLNAHQGTGAVLLARFDPGSTIPRHVGCLKTFHMRKVAIGTLALAKAIYGVELVDFGTRDIARPELAAV